MRSKLSEFVEVLSFEISWLEANPLWVLVSFLIYASLAGLFLNAIRMSIKFEKIHEEERKNLWQVFKRCTHYWIDYCDNYF